MIFFQGGIRGLQFGEGLLFPCYDIVLDKLAPTATKASYFAIGEVKQVGFFLGAFLGGLAYQAGGSLLLFGGSACVLMLSLAAMYVCTEGSNHFRA